MNERSSSWKLELRSKIIYTSTKKISMFKNSLYIIVLLLMTTSCQTNKIALQDKSTSEKENSIPEKEEVLTGNPYKVERT